MLLNIDFVVFLYRVWVLFWQTFDLHQFDPFKACFKRSYGRCLDVVFLWVLVQFLGYSQNLEPLAGQNCYVSSTVPPVEPVSFSLSLLNSSLGLFSVGFCYLLPVISWSGSLPNVGLLKLCGRRQQQIMRKFGNIVCKH